MKNLRIFKNGVQHLTPLLQVVLTVHCWDFLMILVFVNSEAQRKEGIPMEGSVGKCRRKGKKSSEFLKLDDAVEYRIHIILA